MRAPVTRAGWRDHYAALHARTGRETAAIMAHWYMLLCERYGEDRA